MSNDPRDLDGSRLRRALHALGRHPELRKQLMDWLVSVEPQLGSSAPVRDDITGPVIDALHDDEDRYEKVLADGTRFEFLYRTKIARDFLLSRPAHPYHVWEPQTTRLLKLLAAAGQGDVLIGGAYFGDHAILLGRQIQPEGRLVHCFEPNDDQRAMLERNAAINELGNLAIQRFGLWSKGSITLRLTGFDSFANAVPAGEGESGFETVSIDDYLVSVGRSLSVIMLDIEGAELEALKGAHRTLDKDRPAVVFEVHREYVDWSVGLLTTPICRVLAERGYTLYAVRDFNTNQDMGEQPIELVPASSVYLEGPPHGFNMLAVPPSLTLDGSIFHFVDGVSPKLLRHKDPALHHPLAGMPE
jgi:FkbM family methyltransferase